MNCGNYKLSKIRAAAIFLVILIAVFTGCAQNINMAAKKDMEISPEPKLITEISTSEDSESFNVLVKGNRLLTYMSVKQPLPLAVLLYFPDTALLDNIKTKISRENEIIGSITASELTEKGHKSKIEILLKKDVPYKAANEGTGFKISFSKPSKALSSPTLSSPVLSSSGSVEKPEEKAKKPAWVNRIDFYSKEAGKSTIIIGTTRPVEYRIKKASPRLLQLKLLNTRLPDYRKFPLITTRFKSAVDRIIPVQTPAMKNTSMFSIELRESVPYYIEQTDDLLLVHFETSSISLRPIEQADLPSWKKVVTQAAAVEEEIKDKKIEDKALLPKATKNYTGEKIALDFYDTDIKNVLRILMEISGKNFAIDKDVIGRVTLTLEKPVPWDQALDLILNMNGLNKAMEGDIIRIRGSKLFKTADELKLHELKTAKRIEKEFKALEPLVTDYITVNYADAKIDILPHLEALIAKDKIIGGKGFGVGVGVGVGAAAADAAADDVARADRIETELAEEAVEQASVSADMRTNTIIITAVPETIKRAKEIVEKLDKVTPQVIIEARIVEATTNFSREIGIQWKAAGGIQQDDSRAGIGPQRGYDVLGGTYGYDMAMNVPDSLLVSSMGGIGFNFTKIAGTPFLLNAMLLAMESEGEGKIISSP
ncbi:MAG: hypothetical protein HF982_04825, partial [Desulfobacteraceae bacterium]|nr:hypothetical protein [Desulfobacteraceae bacterium]MBC2718903.1 secretin and TonB N-terminal domain-containing protein [Desulfobacteraceae bacterium]